MTATPSELRPARTYREPAFDSFVLVIALLVAAIWALAGSTTVWDTAPLAAVVGLTAVLASVQWVALLRRFALRPPALATAIGVAGVVAGAALRGEEGALIALSLALVLVYTWRIVRATETRYADVAYAVTAVALFGYLPANAILVRRLPTGYGGFLLMLAVALAFSATQAVLSRPARDGTRSADALTIGAIITAALVGLLGGVVLHQTIGWSTGFLLGIVGGALGALGQALLGMLAPAPEVHGRRVRRHPLFIDALIPLFFISAGGFFVLRYFTIK